MKEQTYLAAAVLIKAKRDAIPRALVTYMAPQSESNDHRDGSDEPADPGSQAMPPAEAEGATTDGGKGEGQEERDKRARSRSDELTLTSADSYRTAGGARDGGAYDSAANRFRSNVEIIEKPRQMIVLLATIAGASYLVRCCCVLSCVLCLCFSNSYHIGLKKQ